MNWIAPVKRKAGRFCRLCCCASEIVSESYLLQERNSELRPMGGRCRNPGDECRQRRHYTIGGFDLPDYLFDPFHPEPDWWSEAKVAFYKFAFGQLPS